MKTVRVFGLRRTGTTWLQSVLEQNFKDVSVETNGPMKHDTYNPTIPNDQYVVFTTTHPHAWIVRYYRHKAYDFITPKRSNCTTLQRWEWDRLQDLAQRYATHTRSYISETKKNSYSRLLIRNEDTMKNPVNTLKTIRDHWNLAPSNKFPEPREPTSYPSGMGYKRDNGEGMPKLFTYYLNAHFYEDFPRENYKVFHSRLMGWYWDEILEETGYNIQTAASYDFRTKDLPKSNFHLTQPSPTFTQP